MFIKHVAEATSLLHCEHKLKVPMAMKYSEFKKWLEERGARFEARKGSHMMVYLNGKKTIFPNQGSKEIGKGLVEKIKKDLGLK